MVQAVETQPQRSFEDEVIEDDQLERDLEEREQLKAALKQPKKDFKEKDVYVKARLESLAKSLEVPFDQPIRVGRFVVTRTANEEAEIAFTRGASTRMSIRPDKQD